MTFQTETNAPASSNRKMFPTHKYREEKIKLVIEEKQIPLIIASRTENQVLAVAAAAASLACWLVAIITDADQKKK